MTNSIPSEPRACAEEYLRRDSLRRICKTTKASCCRICRKTAKAKDLIFAATATGLNSFACFSCVSNQFPEEAAAKFSEFLMIEQQAASFDSKPEPAPLSSQPELAEQVAFLSTQVEELTRQVSRFVFMIDRAEQILK